MVVLRAIRGVNTSQLFFCCCCCCCYMRYLVTQVEGATQESDRAKGGSHWQANSYCSHFYWRVRVTHMHLRTYMRIYIYKCICCRRQMRQPNGIRLANLTHKCKMIYTYKYQPIIIIMQVLLMRTLTPVNLLENWRDHIYI